MEKAFGRSDIIKCVPIIWHELVKMKGRVEQVLSTLSNKRVRDEKLIEFKKQILSNKSLKEYFKNHPTEKTVLQNDIQKNQYKDKVLFKNLATLPFYSVPKEIMATTKEQIVLLTAGSGGYVPDWLVKQGEGKEVSENMSIQSKLGKDFKLMFVDPDEAQHSSLLRELLQFPQAAERYSQ
jgi:hypothetical protein